MSDSLTELKEQLTKLGVSTTTPGLRGRERLEELKNRLEDALMNDSRSLPQERGGTSLEAVVNSMSSAQIREHLNLLGQVLKVQFVKF
jgi:hypothetical protein